MVDLLVDAERDVELQSNLFSLFPRIKTILSNYKEESGILIGFATHYKHTETHLQGLSSNSPPLHVRVAGRRGEGDTIHKHH